MTTERVKPRATLFIPQPRVYEYKLVANVANIKSRLKLEELGGGGGGGATGRVDVCAQLRHNLLQFLKKIKTLNHKRLSIIVDKDSQTFQEFLDHLGQKVMGEGGICLF